MGWVQRDHLRALKVEKKNLNFNENLNESRSGFSPRSLTAALNGTEADEPRWALRVQSKTWNQLTRDWAAANIYQQYRLPLRLLFSAPGLQPWWNPGSPDGDFYWDVLFKYGFILFEIAAAVPITTTKHSTTQHNTLFRLGDPLQPDLWRNRRLTCTHISVIKKKEKKSNPMVSEERCHC